MASSHSDDGPEWFRYDDDEYATHATSNAEAVAYVKRHARTWFDRFCETQMPKARTTGKLEGLMFRSDAVNSYLRVVATGAAHKPISEYFFTFAVRGLAPDDAGDFDELAWDIAVELVAQMPEQDIHQLQFFMSNDLGDVSEIVI